MTNMRADKPGDAQDAFQQLAGLAFNDHSMESVMSTIAELTKNVVPGADEVSVTLLQREKAKTVAFTGELALTLDERQYARGYGPCLDGSAAGEMVEISDMTTEQRWRDYTKVAAKAGALSSLTVPVPLQREVSAALNIYSTQPRAFDDDSRTLAKTFASYAGVALANMHLYEAQSALAQQLQQAMESRAVIDQAKGILMGARRCTAEQAFDILVNLSQHSNRKLRDVAQALVDNAVVGASQG